MALQSVVVAMAAAHPDSGGGAGVGPGACRGVVARVSARPRLAALAAVGIVVTLVGANTYWHSLTGSTAGSTATGTRNGGVRGGDGGDAPDSHAVVVPPRIRCDAPTLQECTARGTPAAAALETHFRPPLAPPPRASSGGGLTTQDPLAPPQRMCPACPAVAPWPCPDARSEPCGRCSLCPVAGAAAAPLPSLPSPQAWSEVSTVALTSKAASTRPITTIQALIDAYPPLPPLSRYPIRDKFSLIIMAYRRPEHLVWQLNRVLQLPSLHKLYLIFNDNVSVDHDKTVQRWLCCDDAAMAGLPRNIAPRTVPPSLTHASHVSEHHMRRVNIGCTMHNHLAQAADPPLDLDSADIAPRVRSLLSAHAAVVEPVFPQLNSMINRFVPPASLQTDVVMFLDDDMAVDNDEVERAFHWSQQYPTQIVGFFPRTVEKSGAEWKYVIPHDRKGHTVYHMVLPGGGTFVNVRLLHLFAEQMPRDIFEFVRDANDCDDIAFNMAASYFTGLPPVYALSTTHTTADVTEKPDAHKGMRAKPDHASMRKKCLKRFIETDYGGVNPLVPTDTMLAPFVFDAGKLEAVLGVAGYGSAYVDPRYGDGDASGGGGSGGGSDAWWWFVVLSMGVCGGVGAWTVVRGRGGGEEPRRRRGRTHRSRSSRDRSRSRE